MLVPVGAGGGDIRWWGIVVGGFWWGRARVVVRCALDHDTARRVEKARADLANALEVTRLDERATVLRRTIATLRERGGAAAPDPVGEFWAWLTRGFFSVKDVGFGLPLAFAVMIEMVSAFGPLGILAYADTIHDASGPDMSRHVRTSRA